MLYAQPLNATSPYPGSDVDVANATSPAINVCKLVRWIFMIIFYFCYGTLLYKCFFLLIVLL
jgi:hypothetical protein